MREEEPKNETVFADVISSKSRKMIVASEFKGKRYLQFREMWRTDSSSLEWNFSKKVVSFNYESFKEIVDKLKRNGINTFQDLLLMFDPNEVEK